MAPKLSNGFIAVLLAYGTEHAEADTFDSTFKLPSVFVLSHIGIFSSLILIIITR